MEFRKSDRPPRPEEGAMNAGSQLEVFARLIRDRRLSHAAFRLWHALRDYTNAASKCFPGQRRLKELEEDASEQWQRDARPALVHERQALRAELAALENSLL